MDICSNLHDLIQKIEKIDLVKIQGTVVSVKGMIISCKGINKFVKIGSICKIIANDNNAYTLCEVVGFEDNIVLLMSFHGLEGLGTGFLIEICQSKNVIYPNELWLGRIVNAFGDPIDDKGPIRHGPKSYPLKTNPLPSQQRNRIGSKIDLGVKAIDTFVSCCYGQRLGIFSGSGIGKSILIAMLTKYADVEVKVIGLIGERGREAKEFIEQYLGEEGLKKSVIIMSTGDESPLMRKRAAYITLSVAEYFRDQNKEVLCIIDSITRFAMAQREIGLAIGEPPTTKGYTPSVFSELPKILERAGPGINGANITGLFSVLVEGDDNNEPISDAVRGLLDGHIILDRSIAERGRFPAIDVLKSVSRTMPGCNSDLENRQIKFARKMLATYQDMADMIKLGAYKKGTDHNIDLAIGYFSKLENFFNQMPNETISMKESYKMLGEIIGIVS